MQNEKKEKYIYNVQYIIYTYHTRLADYDCRITRPKYESVNKIAVLACFRKKSNY